MVDYPRVIAFTGPKTCGKDTCANALLAQNKPNELLIHFVRTPFAEGVKSICSETFGWDMDQMDDQAFKDTKLEVFPFIEPRWALMDIANFMRDKYSGQVWVERAKRKVASLHEDYVSPIACVITDLRFPEELEWLKSIEACIIYVRRDIAEAALAEGQAKGNAKDLNVSESHYRQLRREASCIVDNNGPIYQAQNEVLSIVKNYYGHWAVWS